MPCGKMLVRPGALIDRLQQMHVDAAAGLRGILRHRLQQRLRAPLHAGRAKLHVDLRARDGRGDRVRQLDIGFRRHRRADEHLLRSCCDRLWRGRREPALHRHTRPGSDRGRPAQRRCGCRRRTPRARWRRPPRPAAWCRSGGCNGSSLPRSPRAPNVPARKLRSNRDRPACRARSGGSSFPGACRARRTRTRSGARGRGR